MTSIDLPRCETIGGRVKPEHLFRDRSEAANIGYGCDRPRDWQQDPLYGVGKKLAIPLYTARRRREVIEQREAAGTTLRAIRKKFGIRPLNQGSTNFCWANAVVHSLHYQQVLTRGQHEVLSPASVACYITGFRNVGGWCGQALKQIVEYGVNSAEEWPPNKIDQRLAAREGMQQRARERRVTEWYDLKPQNWDELATFLVLGIPVAIALLRMRHAMLAIDLAIEKGKEIVIVDNSWGSSWGDDGLGKLSREKAIPDEAVAPRVQAVWRTNSGR